MGLHVLSECEQCCDRFRASGGPPCNKDLMTGRFRIVLQTKQAIGNGMLPQCPFIASAPEIMGWVKSTQPVSALGAEDWAKRSIEEIRAKLKAKPGASDNELGVSDLRRAQIGSKDNFLVVFASAARPGYDCLFLRPMKNMSEHKQFFEANGLALPPGQRSKNQTQQNTISDKRKPHMFPPVTPSGEAQGTFVPWQQVDSTAKQQGVDSFINWDAIQYGYEKAGGKSIGVQVNSPYGLGPVMNGCHNVETAFNNAADPNQQYFGSAFAKILAKNGKKPNGSWWPVALQVLGQLGVTVGIMGGAAAVGFIGGALAKRYFLLPGLSTGQCAVGGASLAVAITSKIMDGLFIMDVAREANAQGDNLKAGVQAAWIGNVAQGAAQIAEVLAALVFAVMQAMLLKLAEGIGKGGVALLEFLRNKLRKTRIGDSPAALKWAQEEVHPDAAKQGGINDGRAWVKIPEPNKYPRDQMLDDAVRKEFQQAQDLFAKAKAQNDGDLELEALGHYIRANRGLQWSKWMNGHSLVVTDVAHFADESILPQLRSMSPDDLVRTLKSQENLELTHDQAAFVIKNAIDEHPGELTDAAVNHDYASKEGAKDRAAVGMPMSNPHKALSVPQLKDLKKIVSQYKDDPESLHAELKNFVLKNYYDDLKIDVEVTVKGQKKIEPRQAYAAYSDTTGKGRLVKDPKGDLVRIYDDPADVSPSAKKKASVSKIAQWWQSLEEENIFRAAETQEGMLRHGVREQHHNKGKKGVNPNAAEAFHQGLDTCHSKVMGGRPYQGPPQHIFGQLQMYGKDDEKAMIIIGQYIFRKYLKATPKQRYSENQVVNCYLLSTDKIKETRLEQL